MAAEIAYAPVSSVYTSKGLIARTVEDQAPPHTYLDLLNMQERAENSYSSRYGYSIVTRDPEGTVGPQNYFFTAPVITLGRLLYLGNSWRYAGLSDGTLWRREGDVQGAYTQIYSGLSGSPFSTVVTNGYQSSQPYIFVWDSDVSIKDMGTGTPQLTGIDPPEYTANTVPYSPLLTLIDNFSQYNTYTASGFTSGWSYGTETTIAATAGQTVTDFSEFFGVQLAGSENSTISGGSVSVSSSSATENSVVYSGFASDPVISGDSATMTVELSGSFGVVGIGGGGTGSIIWSYSINSGASWTAFYSASFNEPGESLPVTLVPLIIPGLADLATFQIQATVIATAIAGTVNTAATTSAITLTISSPGIFNEITNGILSVLNSNGSINVPIVSIASTSFSSGAYQALTIVCGGNHGLTGTNNYISVYGSSNDLLDGFYMATAVNATTITVPYVSSVYLNAVGGTLNGGASAPSTCVLTNEYAAPYPNQMTAWGFYQQVPTSTTSFPVGFWTGAVAQNTTATVGVTVPINLNINNQATDDDLIVLVIQVSDPASIESIVLQFDVNNSGYTSSYYYKNLSPAYYQQNVEQLEDAYTAQSQQIFADTLGLFGAQPPNSITAQLQPANISTGQGSWQTAYLRRGDFVAVGSAGESGTDWTTVTGWQLVITTNTVGGSSVSVNGLYFQWGYGPSSFGGVGYDYRYTYYNQATGTESNGSPEQQFNLQFGYLSSLIAPIYLRQAAQVTGRYSTDSQVTHVRQYRRGGTFSDQWFLFDQIPNITAGGTFYYKDVIPDAALQQAPPLILDNDPPVTSSLQNPINTTLAAALISPSLQTYYSTFSPQTITVADSGAVFVPDQIVDIGTASTLEQVRVITGGTGSFTAIVRLQHNAGEPVYVFSIPRQPCNLSAIAYGKVWLAGDPNNPNFLYYSKGQQPESYGPQNYIPVGSSGDRIIAVINWRGQLVVETLTTWYLIVNGNPPYAQPTGSKHGGPAIQGWTQDESAIWYRAADGLRRFQGADGVFMSLPVDFVYKQTPQTPIPLADPTQASQDVLCYFNQYVYASYVSLNGGQRYRMIWDANYQRYRYDDIPATAMLWEQDTNTFLCGVEISTGNYAVVQDQVPNQDYDDGGWSAGSLVKKPINISIQHPYSDLGKPHFPKQFNMLETDANTQGQVMNTELLFNTEPPTSLTLQTASTTQREKIQLPINAGDGYEAYSMSIKHTMSVTIAPVFYQENIYAAVLAANVGTTDTYWLEFGTKESKICKEVYFDFTSTQPITVNFYADGSLSPYYTFVLGEQPNRWTQRVRLPALKFRDWRMVMTSPTVDGLTVPYQLWTPVLAKTKMVCAGNGYQNHEVTRP